MVTFECPYCEFGGGRLDTHAHLVSEHQDHLEMDVRDGDDATIYFTLACPECDEGTFTKDVNRSLRDDRRAIEQYREELAMIAFDQLLYHLEGEHDS